MSSNILSLANDPQKQSVLKFSIINSRDAQIQNADKLYRYAEITLSISSILVQCCANSQMKHELRCQNLTRGKVDSITFLSKTFFYKLMSVNV